MNTVWEDADSFSSSEGGDVGQVVGHEQGQFLGMDRISLLEQLTLKVQGHGLSSYQGHVLGDDAAQVRGLEAHVEGDGAECHADRGRVIDRALDGD